MHLAYLASSENSHLCLQGAPERTNRVEAGGSLPGQGVTDRIAPGDSSPAAWGRITRLEEWPAGSCEERSHIRTCAPGGRPSVCFAYLFAVVERVRPRVARVAPGHHPQDWAVRASSPSGRWTSEKQGLGSCGRNGGEGRRANRRYQIQEGRKRRQRELPRVAVHSKRSSPIVVSRYPGGSAEQGTDRTAPLLNSGPPLG